MQLIGVDVEVAADVVSLCCGKIREENVKIAVCDWRGGFACALFFSRAVIVV